MRWKGAVVAAAVLVIGAGCNGDDDASPATTSEAPASTTSEPEASSSTTLTSPPSTTATTDPTTTAPETTPSTDAPTTTASPTSTTVDAPTTTVAPDDRVANTLAIIRTAERSFEIYNAALQDPLNDEKADALAEVYTPRLVEGWMNIIEEFRTDNLRTVPNPDVPARYDVDVNSVELNLSNGTGSVQACHLNTFIEVEVGGNADGSDRIVDDEVTEQVEQLELIREDGVWRINAADVPDESDVVTPCG